MSVKAIFLSSLCLLYCAIPSVAQEQEVERDSLRSYDLDEIVISGGQQQEVKINTLQRLSLASLAQSEAATVDQVARLIPAAHVQTNSRGETLVYLRNVGERQVAYFFGGALMNIPWDYRFDLGMLPAGVLGGMTVAKGVPSVLYGTNVLGGAINMRTRSLEHDGIFTEARISGGAPGAFQSQVTHLGRRGRNAYAVSVGYNDRDGIALSKDAQLPYSQPDEAKRTNTDRRLLNLFGQVTRDMGQRGTLGLSVLHVDGNQGVAPESHLNPEEARVRFWRYPLWQQSMLTVNGDLMLQPKGLRLRGAIWGSRFVQHIDQYASVRYESLQQRQEDQDWTLGTRLTLLQPVRHGELRFALNALTSLHDQRDIDRVEDGGVLDRSFQQHIYSLGVEYEGTPSERLQWIIGGSLDGIATPNTGDKPARDPQMDYGITTGIRYAIQENATLRASMGRKLRFPTMRELFGESLGRFLLNPDLKAESSFLSEVGLERRGVSFSGEVIAFYNRTFDTIEVQSVQVPGEDRSRRQRVNLDGSRVTGVEIVGIFEPSTGTTIEGHVTGMRSKGLEGTATRPLVERPDWLCTLTLSHRRPRGFFALAQAVYTGRAYGLGEDNSLKPLPTSLVLNLRASYRLIYARQRTVSTEVFVHLNNATDALVLPQLGLPAPGREIRVGIEVSL